jgi:alcohol dehydrogenase
VKAIRYDAFRSPLELVSLPDPEPSPEGVVIQVEATGLCLSDWHGWMGHDQDITPPHVPGHEWAGTIVAAGPGVRRWKTRQRVTAPFCLGCGRCAQCRAGQPQICDDYEQPGFTLPGSFAEFVAVPFADVNLVELPAELPSVAAVLLGCRFATAWRAVVTHGRPRPGQWVAVHGCGGVGLSAIMIATALGARPVGVDLTPEKLSIAKQLGAEHVVNAREAQDVPAAIRDLTGGAHVSLDTLGSAVTCTNSIASLRKRGRHVQVGLMAGLDAAPAIPMGPIIAGELEIVGSHGLAAHDYPAMLDLILRGRLPVDRLRARTIALEEAVSYLPRMGEFRDAGVTVIAL